MQFRLIAGTHVGPDSHGVTRMWTAKSGHDIIDTHQDLNSLNARGFPPKFQPLSAAPAGEAELLQRQAEIEQQLAALRQLRETPAPAVAPIAAGAPQAPPMLTDPRDAISPEHLVRNAKHNAAQSIIDACSKMDEDELRGFCEGEEIDIPDGASKADMMAIVVRMHATA